MPVIAPELIGWVRLDDPAQLNYVDQHEPLISYYSSMLKPRQVDFAYNYCTKKSNFICNIDPNWKHVYYYYPKYFYNNTTESIACQVYKDIFSEAVKSSYQELSPETLNWVKLNTLKNINNVIKRNSLFYLAYREHYLLPWEVDLITTKDIPTNIIENNKLEMYYYYCDIPEIETANDISILKLAAVRIYTECFNKTYNIF